MTTNKEGMGRERSPPSEVLKLLIISKLSEENKMENKAYTTYTWHTATGDVTEEISEYWAGIMADLDRGDYNNDHKQFRDARRCGTEIGEMEDKMIEDSFDLEESVIGDMRAMAAMELLTDVQKTITEALIGCRGNVLEASKTIGMNRTVMQDQIPLIRNKVGAFLGVIKVIDDVETGKNVRKYRIDNGFSASDMAEILDISKRIYFHWEKGETRIPDEWLETIADCLEVGVKDLIAYKKF